MSEPGSASDGNSTGLPKAAPSGGISPQDTFWAVLLKAFPSLKLLLDVLQRFKWKAGDLESQGVGGPHLDGQGRCQILQMERGKDQKMH